MSLVVHLGSQSTPSSAPAAAPPPPAASDPTFACWHAQICPNTGARHYFMNNGAVLTVPGPATPSAGSVATASSTTTYQLVPAATAAVNGAVTTHTPGNGGQDPTTTANGYVFINQFNQPVTLQLGSNGGFVTKLVEGEDVCGINCGRKGCCGGDSYTTSKVKERSYKKRSVRYDSKGRKVTSEEEESWDRGKYRHMKSVTKDQPNQCIIL